MTFGPEMGPANPQCICETMPAGLSTNTSSFGDLVAPGLCRQIVANLEAKELSHKIAQFSSALHNAVASEKKNENLVMSALSTKVLLAMLSLGAKGETQTELLDALQLPNDAFIRSSFKALSNKLKNVKNVTLEVANKVYVKEGGFPLHAKLQRASVEIFDAGIEELNFPDGAYSAEVVNKWVKSKTNNRINDILSASDFDNNTTIVLVNALYFKGTWKKQFDKELTRSHSFTTSVGAQVMVSMMFIESKFNYFDCPVLGAQFLELPYKDGETSMVLVLPGATDGLPSLQSSLAMERNIRDVIADMHSVTVNVIMPRFKIETIIDLIAPLQKVGISRIFNEIGSQLTKLIPEPAYVSKAIQKAFIEVNEEGVEVAAATACVDSVDPRITYFHATRPFLYYLFHGETMLFSGAINTFEETI